MNTKAIIFFGKSGSGKGTQAELLINKIQELDPERKVIYVETGKLLREFAKGQNFSHKKVFDTLDQGGLLQEFMPINLWSNKMINENTGNEHLVFDGVARRPNEAPVLDSALDFYGVKDKHAILIDVSKEWAIARLLGRGRKDDNEDDIKARLEWYDEYVKDSLKYYEDNPEYGYHKINGEQTIEQVHTDILQALNLA